MKKFIFSMVGIFLISLATCLYYNQFHNHFDYKVEGALNGFELGGGIDEYFFAKPSEMEVVGGNQGFQSSFIDKNGNVVENNDQYVSEVIQHEIKHEIEDISEAELLKRDLENADCIVIAKIQDDFEVIHRTVQQPLYIERVIRGDQSLENETIFLQNKVQQIWIDAKLIGGKVNLMKPDVEYLIFLEEVNDIVSKKQKIYYCVSPIGYFRLDDVENKVVNLNNKAMYRKYENNEFMATDEIALEKILAFKKEILEEYLGQ